MRVERRWVIAASSAAVLLASIALALGRHAGTALVVSDALPDPDAIVALASHEWERLPEAVSLAAQYPRALVLLTVPESVTVFNCHDCARRPERLARAGITPDRIHALPLMAPGTHGEALAVRDFARAHGLERVMVVTSPYHTRRALATFRHVLRETRTKVGIAAARHPDPAIHPDRWWDAPHEISYVRYEWAAVLYYQVRYGVPAFD